MYSFASLAGKQAEVEKEMVQVNSRPKLEVRLNDLKLVLGPELRIVYPLILNFAVSGELELNGIAHPKWIKPKGVLTFENGDVNLVATQVIVFILFILWSNVRCLPFTFWYNKILKGNIILSESFTVLETGEA